MKIRTKSKKWKKKNTNVKYITEHVIQAKTAPHFKKRDKSEYLENTTGEFVEHLEKARKLELNELGDSNELPMTPANAIGTQP